MGYHDVKIPCPVCHRDGTILNFCVHADGGVMLECLCVICGGGFSWETTFARLIIAANELDKADKPFDFANMPTQGKPC